MLLLTNRDIHEVLDMGRCLDEIEGMAHEIAAGDSVALGRMADLVSGRRPGRTSPDQTTFFHNIGAIGEGFAAVGAGIYERALERGIGTEIPTSWFLEDIRD